MIWFKIQVWWDRLVMMRRMRRNIQKRDRHMRKTFPPIAYVRPDPVELRSQISKITEKIKEQAPEYEP